MYHRSQPSACHFWKYLIVISVWHVAFLTAKPVPAKLFSDHMVLQREATTTFWGRGDENERITVEVAGAVGTAVVSGGVFQIPLALPKAGGPHKLVFRGNGTVTFENVMVGDVWVCAGGMNMDAAVASLPEKNPILSNLPAAGLRLLRTSRQVLSERGNDEPALTGAWTNGWAMATPSTASGFSAVAVAFGSALAAKTVVAVGLIQASYGNMTLESWLPKETLEAVPELRVALAPWEKVMAVWPQTESNFVLALSNWQVAADLAKSNGTAVPKKPEEPLGPRHEKRPGGLYWGMVAPLQKLAVKGVVWYGGEAHGVDYDSAALPAVVFPALIDTWRRQWNQPAMPFAFVQIPGFRRPTAEPDDAPLSYLRESMAKALALSNVGMAATLDLGDEGDPVPKRKQAVGDRLATWALGLETSVPVVPNPVLGSTTLSLGKATLKFKNVGSGLVASSIKVGQTTLGTNAIRGFAICGPDRRFVWADARFTSSNTLELTSAKVNEVSAVRYAWSAFPLANLTTAEGLPLLPFRTDNFPSGWAFRGSGLAIGKKVTASDPAPETVYQGLCDGSLFDSPKNIWVSGPTNAFPKIATIDLGRLCAVKEIRLYPSSFGGTRTVSVSVSADGTTFTPYDTVVFSNRVVEPETLPNQSRDGIRHVRLTFPDCHTPGFLGQTNARVSLRELEVIGEALK